MRAVNRSSLVRLGLTLTMFASFSACSASSRDSSVNAAGDDAGPPATTTPTTDDGGEPIITTDRDAGNQAGCSDEAKLVYVLSLEGDLYSFAPDQKKFTKIGPLDCPEVAKLTPISMAVDRDAIAWVNMRNPDFNPFLEDPPKDTLFKVDTKTGKCSPSKIKAYMGGMGFSIDTVGKPEETLYVDGQSDLSGSSGLARVDFKTEQLVPIKSITGVPSQTGIELTGTGEGKLFALLVKNPMGIAELNKSSAAALSPFTLAQVELPKAPMYAFSHWGGDFYIYTATDESPAKTSRVSRYRPSDGSVDTSYMTNIGFHIVGAGVSTCAPTAPPK